MTSASPLPTRPAVPPHLDVWLTEEPTGPVLHVGSTTRVLTLEGHTARRLYDDVLPLLDGSRTVPQILTELDPSHRALSPGRLTALLELLHDHHLLAEGAEAGSAVAGDPYAASLFELGVDRPGRPVAELAERTVTVVGLAGAGAAAAAALVAAGIGTVRLLDPDRVTRSDPRLCASYRTADVGRPRAEALADALSDPARPGTVAVVPADAEPKAAADAAVAGADVVVTALDAGRAALAYLVNAASLRHRVPSTTGTVSASEVVLGPTVQPFRTACFHCYRVRQAAVAEHPSDAAAYELFQHQAAADGSAYRENTAFAAGLAGSLLASEAVAVLTGVVEPAALGRLVVLDLRTLASKRHHVLRRPRCPACSAPPAAAVTDPIVHQNAPDQATPDQATPDQTPRDQTAPDQTPPDQELVA